MRIPVVRKVLEANDVIAGELRSGFEDSGLLAVNLMGSPGAGKTSLVEQTLKHVGERLRIGVIEGDVATSLDAERVARCGAPVVQINTGGACHLDAAMIRKALGEFDLSALDVLLIENVGNLVCPAQFDLGEAARVVVCSLPEGDDKVLKYPAIFSRVSAVVLNKLDLIGHLEFDRDNFRLSAAELNPRAALFEVSCATGEGLDEWAAWLEREARRAQKSCCRDGGLQSPAQSRG